MSAPADAMVELRCPECTSPEVATDPHGSVDDRCCGNCRARFPRDSCLLTIAEAEVIATSLPAKQAGGEACALFELDPWRAESEITDVDGDLWPINAFSDADEVHALITSALEVGVISSADHCAGLYIYPLALSEPDPLVAVELPAQPTMLGHSLRMREREGENPVQFTLRLLEDVVEEANALCARLETSRCGGCQ